MDLRGLAALYGKINTLLDERDVSIEETPSLDLFGLSKFLHRRGERDRAHSTCAMALDAGLPAEFRPQATRDLAQMAKRHGDKESAARLWLELVSEPQDGITACEQLAIHYERHVRDFVRALEYANLALAKLARARKLTREPFAAARSGRLEEKFRKRIKRLEVRSGMAKAAPLLALTDSND
jgi:lipopolysaccharide biosynthesis regulator YciM